MAAMRGGLYFMFLAPLSEVSGSATGLAIIRVNLLEAHSYCIALYISLCQKRQVNVIESLHKPSVYIALNMYRECSLRDGR